ncbi:MAG: hypothetical protein QOE65_1650 [Solirubrobacteraceae bacterium]|jgi:WD40 repeat protein|nr:hypothetical protein [Solirubrobacteraceae bacterium]
MADAFISYSRGDKAFVQRLHAALRDRGKEVWVDWEDIPASVDWREELRTGIESADALVFVLSPESVHSEVCAQELEQAQAQGKRIVPLLHRDLDGVPVPEALSSRNWIFLRTEEEFQPGVDRLVETLETDIDAVRVHTRLLVRAGEWDRHGRDRSYLLSGSDLQGAEGWVAAPRDAREPDPTVLQRDYIAASRAATARRQRRILTGVATALVVALVLAVVAFVQRGAAIDQKHGAQSRGLAAQSVTALPSDPELAVLLAERGLEVKRTREADLALRRAIGEDHLRLTARAGRRAVTGAQLSPDGRTLLGAVSDGTARLWDAHTGRTRAVLRGHRGIVRGAVFSDAGRRVVTFGQDGTIDVRDSATRRLLATLRGRRGPLVVASPDPAARHVAAVDASGTLREWTTLDGRLVEAIRGPRGAHPDSLSLARGVALTADPDGTVRRWDLGARRFAGTLGRVRPGVVTTVAVAPDARTLAAGSEADPAVHLWSAAGRPRGRVLSSAGVLQLAFSHDSRRLVGAGSSAEGEVWDVPTLATLATLRGHESFLLDARFSRDGNLVGTAADDGTARVWRASDGAPVEVLSGHTGRVGGVVFSRDGRRAVTSSEDGTARVWETSPGRTLRISRVRALRDADLFGSRVALAGDTGGAPRAARAVRFSPDGARVARGGAGGVAVSAGRGRGATLALATGRDTVTGVDWSRDGRRLLAATQEGRTYLWDARSGRRLGVRGGAPGPVAAARFSPSGRAFLTAEHDGATHVWNARTLAQTTVVRGHVNSTGGPAGAVQGADFSPDGRTVLTWSYDGTARTWDARRGRPLRRLVARSVVNQAAFSPDGALIVTANADALARLWDARTGRPLARLRGHVASVTGARFSPDGREVATASADGTAALWDVRSGQRLAVMGGHLGPVRAVAFDRGGRRILTTGTDETARTFACDVCGSTDDVLAAAQRLVRRGLTRAERQRFLNGL